MKLLLDTHIFLWYITNDEHLSAIVSSNIRDENNEVYLSAVSVWEALVKYSLGRLAIPSPADEYLRAKQEQHRIVELPLASASIGPLLRLPPLHRDPFDRMLICQAIHHGLTLVTADEHILRYPSASVMAG